jgi:hypothetical protein
MVKLNENQLISAFWEELLKDMQWVMVDFIAHCIENTFAIHKKEH